MCPFWERTFDQNRAAFNLCGFRPTSLLHPTFRRDILSHVVLARLIVSPISSRFTCARFGNGPLIRIGQLSTSDVFVCQFGSDWLGNSEDISIFVDKPREGLRAQTKTRFPPRRKFSISREKTFFSTWFREHRLMMGWWHGLYDDLILALHHTSTNGWFPLFGGSCKRMPSD